MADASKTSVLYHEYTLLYLVYVRCYSKGLFNFPSDDCVKSIQEFATNHIGDTIDDYGVPLKEDVKCNICTVPVEDARAQMYKRFINYFYSVYMCMRISTTDECADTLKKYLENPYTDEQQYNRAMINYIEDQYRCVRKRIGAKYTPDYKKVLTQKVKSFLQVRNRHEVAADINKLFQLLNTINHKQYTEAIVDDFIRLLMKFRYGLNIDEMIDLEMKKTLLEIQNTPPTLPNRDRVSTASGKSAGGIPPAPPPPPVESAGGIPLSPSSSPVSAIPQAPPLPPVDVAPGTSVGLPGQTPTGARKDLLSSIQAGKPLRRVTPPGQNKSSTNPRNSLLDQIRGKPILNKVPDPDEMLESKRQQKYAPKVGGLFGALKTGVTGRRYAMESDPDEEDEEDGSDWEDKPAEK